MNNIPAHQRVRHPAAWNSRGVTLVEVLIAVIVLSVGLLGIAGLQVVTTKYKMGSGVRSAIAVLYSDFTDRVRLNPTMAGPNWLTGQTSPDIGSSDIDSSKYTYQATWAVQQGVQDNQLVSTACDASSTCSPSQRADYDMLTWRKRVRENLPQGAVFIAGNRSTGIDVTMMWMDKENTDKTARTDDRTSATQVSLVTSANCSTNNTETGLAQQTCCPPAASVPAGVRCARFSFMP
ncbi:type IV pilus modification protein PilV [Rhodoferax koreense]|uniref:Type IV pilus modification protein PilV n=1 Tax=Rhodoferax koreensis TaxID=1842727 RepID=A0A1P8JZ49_9BURK|nr:type IV pilus modification protein PilV [Rhodoferax koreense]APW39032.1 type IV pilus modification protein PilV [Rhodoferax koreense]